MTSTEAAAIYQSVKSTFEADEIEYNLIKNTRIVEARTQVGVIEQQATAAKRVLNDADTTSAIKLARTELEYVNANLENAVQLVDNLTTKLRGWKTLRTQRRHDLDVSHRQMWTIKRKELLDSFSLSEDTVTKIENLIAANDGIDPGFKPRQLGDVINEKHKVMEGDSISIRRANLMAEMGI